ncbi:MAG: sugar phosphate isomerase/epimerase family protein [Terriglobia bacterium]
MLSRRGFLKYGAGSAAAAALLGGGARDVGANPLGLPIGCQTWPVRAMIAKDFPGTIKTLANAGFQSIELCSPIGYARMGFAGVGKYSGVQFKRILRDAGVTCISSHFGIDELRKDQERSIAWAKEVGLTQMMVPSLEGPRPPTVDDVKRAADEYNRIAENAARAGIQQGLHNEDWTTSMTADGQRVYDLLFKFLDPRLVKFQFQVSEVSQGYDPVTYFRRYPGRFISMHVQGWSSKTRQITPIGQGTLNWREIFAAAKIGGVKNYYVEMSLPMMKASVPYLRKLRV